MDLNYATIFVDVDYTSLNNKKKGYGRYYSNKKLYTTHTIKMDYNFFGLEKSLFRFMFVFFLDRRMFEIAQFL